MPAERIKLYSVNARSYVYLEWHANEGIYHAYVEYPGLGTKCLSSYEEGREEIRHFWRTFCAMATLPRFNSEQMGTMAGEFVPWKYALADWEERYAQACPTPEVSGEEEV